MSVVQPLLTEAEGSAVAVERADGRSPFVLICEHASNRLPQSLGSMGLSEEALVSHIAWDPGALATALTMSALLDAPLVHQRFSRLVYDCNRPPEAPGAMPEQSEIYAIPGNMSLSQSERDRRTQALYLPFHAEIEALIGRRRAAGLPSILVTMHSFTPVYMGKSRSVEIGILHDSDSRLADAMLAAAKDKSNHDIRRNEPYGPADGVTHTLVKHGLAHDLANVMIEVRNDLIATENSQRVMAGFLADLLGESLKALKS